MQFPGLPGQEHPPMPATMKQVAAQLDQWRGMLPAYLRWSDGPSGATAIHANSNMANDQHTTIPVPQVIFNSTAGDMFSQPTPQPAFLFTSDLDAPPQRPYPYAIDIQAALLRTRYYWARHLVHRPYLYKALHHPEHMTRDDAAGAAECLRACLKWPITMVPTSRNKRLVPCLFFWSQNLLGVLVILHLSQSVPLLVRIRTSLCGDNFEVEANETASLCIDWIRDLRMMDPTAGWCWDIVKTIYRIDD